MKLFLGFILLLFTVGLGYIPNQDDFWIILSLYIPSFIAYLILYKTIDKQSEVVLFLLVGIIIRCSLLFSFPALSDDIYRYIWDGKMSGLGISPYLYTPSQYLELNTDSSLSILFTFLNSPDYHSIYPPVSQWVFTLAIKIFSDNWLLAAALMRLIIICAEAGIIYLLLKILPLLGLTQKRALLYALNPLIIIELSGNLHFEGIMIFFFLLSSWFFLRKKWMLSGLFFATSVGVKLLPIIFIPFFIRRLGLKQALLWLSSLTIAGIFIFFPFFDFELLNNLFDSIELYFKKFEFNASVYYILRWVGYHLSGYNIIHTLGPILSIATVLWVLYLVRKERELSLNHLFKYALFAYTGFLFFSTTIHPWYLSVPVFLCLFTFYRYPVIWTVLVIGTYYGYMATPYKENMWIVAAEYFIVGLLVFFETSKVPIFRIVPGFLMKWLEEHPVGK